MRRCPKCKATDGILTERRPNGNSVCNSCGWRDSTASFDAAATTSESKEVKRFMAAKQGDNPWDTEHPKLCVLATDYDTLKQERDEYKAALKFYADREHWTNASATNCAAMIGPDDHDAILTNKFSFNGGRIAREALAKHAGGTNGQG